MSHQPRGGILDGLSAVRPRPLSEMVGPASGVPGFSRGFSPAPPDLKNEATCSGLRVTHDKLIAVSTASRTTSRICLIFIAGSRASGQLIDPASGRQTARLGSQ